MIRVTRLGKILQFGLLFKGSGKFLGEMWFVVAILIDKKGFDVDVLYFPIELC